MADNMIELVASLNVSDSAKQINKVDIPLLQDKIKGIKIKCELDTDNLSSIQSQLTNISKNLKIEIPKVDMGLSDSNVTSVVSEIHNALSNTNTNFKINVDEGALDDVKNSLHNIGLELEKDIGDAKGIQKIVDYFKELDIQVTKVKPKFEETSDSVKKLVSLTVQGINTKTGAVVNIVDQLDDSDKKVAKTTTTITQNLAKVEQENKKIEDSAKAAQLAYNDFLKLKGQVDVYSKQYAGEDSLKTQLTDIQKLIGEFDNTQPLEKQREGIINIDNALKLLKVDIDNIKKASTPVVAKGASDFYPNIAKGASTQDTISNAKNTLNELFAKTAGMEEDTANRIKRAVEDTTGALQRFYVQVERGDKSVETLTYALNEQGNAYEYLGKTIREADNSTDFRRKDITTQWDIQTQKLQQFIANAEKAGAASTVLSDDIANLKNKLNDKGDTSAMNSFLDDFDIAKAKFQAFNAEMRKDNAIANRQNRIRKLTDDINSYAAANQRATKSNKEMSNGKIFADEWSRIISEMAKGAELTDQEIKQLEADLKSFQKNAKASGEAGASAFERFANSFKVISTYISANQIINRLTSYISSAVNELRNIDDILTEISKTSDITTENLKELGYASYDAASAYGRVASDYLLGVQEFSRAGYDEASAKSMAELSLKAQAAGDMTAEMANQYIIATGAAYQLSDNENELNKVLDSQNYITNHNAINMEQLASATKLVASQAASSGVGIDEMTAAVGTMSATTQQAGEVSGRAFKGILMNLQQVKGAAEDIGDGGEDITEESLSKYEKASEALGVSLKEIKNGTLQLRNPMEVLRDLAKEVEKEGESSLKVANLVAAIGGKYRGNSLIALLRNWDTYEKMLSEFNSTDAVGSAMDEAAKSANNWNGQINKLKNTWTELVNRFVSSDDAIALIGSLNDLITSISDDKNISTLSNLAKTLQSIFVLVSNLSTKIGTLPTLIGGLGFISSLKSSDSILKIFSTVEDKTSSLGRSFTVLGKTGGLSLNSLTTGLTKAKIASVGLQVATAALNATITLGLSLAISAVIAGISKLINKEKEAQEQAKKRAEEAKARRKEAVESIKSYDDEVTAIQDLVSQYVKIVSSTSDLSVEKEKLLSIQDQIIDKYGAEAEGIDLVNGKLEDNINLLLQSQEEKNKQWQRENYQALEDAEKYFKDRDLTLTNFVVGLDKTGMMDKSAQVKAERYVSVMKKAFEEAGVGDLFNFTDYTSKTGANLNGRLMETERTYSVQLKKGLSVEQQKRALEAYEDVYNRILEKQKKYDDVIFSFGGKRHQQLNSIIDTFTGYYDILKQNEEIEESNLSIDQILGNVDDLQKYEDTLSDLTTLSQKINSEDYTPTQKYGFFQQITEGKEAINELVQQYPALRDIATATLESIGLSADGVIQSETDLFESFYEDLDDGHKKAIGNISTIEKAMETLSKGESVSHDDAWAMLRLDTEGLLGVPTITSTGEYKFKIQNLIKFKDSYIEKTKESIQADIEEAQTSRETTLQKIEDRKAELQAINDVISAQAIGNSKPSDEIISQQRDIQLTIANLEDIAKNYGDEIERDNILLREYNSHLGNTISAEAQAENPKAQAENLKAQENKIDDIVESLENEKETLQNQLDVLNEQKETLEDILNKYETISSVVSDFIQKQIDSLEKQKSEIEDTYNAQIEKLQEANEEHESAIALIEKQNALENAQNNKVRYYDETRGYVYGVDKEQLQNAQNDLDSALSEQTIKNLEKERDERTAMFDAQIEALEDYAEMWDSVIDDIKSAGDEQLASEVLGENWRTELTAMNIDIYNRFEANYTAYNDQLQRLTDGEITSLENAIKAKEDEIDSWSDYKTQIQNAAKEIEDSLTNYESKLDSVALTEQSSYSDRIANLSDFVAQYSALMSGIANIDMSSMFANVGSNILSAFNGARSLFGNGANLVGASQSLAFNIDKVVSESPEAFVKAMETYAKNLKIKWEVSK